MRSLSHATRMAMEAQETGEVFLTLLAVTHELMSPLYFVNNTVNIVSGGITYTAGLFDVQIPDDREDEMSRVRLVIDNIDRRVVEAVRSIETPAVLVLTWIRAADPDVPIAGPFRCTLRNVTYDALTVSGDLWAWEDILNEPFPQHVFDPSRFRGLFG